MISNLHVIECDNCGVSAVDKNKGTLVADVRRDGWLVQVPTGSALCPECNKDRLHAGNETRGG